MSLHPINKIRPEMSEDERVALYQECFNYNLVHPDEELGLPAHLSEQANRTIYSAVLITLSAKPDTLRQMVMDSMARTISLMASGAFKQ